MEHITTKSSIKGYLNADDVRRLAPSVFCQQAAPGASSKYQYVDTAGILSTLEGMGYVPVKAGQSKSRRPDGSHYSKHVVRVMHKNYLVDGRQVGDVVPQIILTNSHDRTSAFHMSAGLFRLVCSNGLAVSSAEFSTVRVLHNDANIHDHIIDGTNLIREITEKTIVPQIATMTKLQLTKSQEIEFATAAGILVGREVTELDINNMLATRREADAGRSMWQVLNRIQENITKGGYKSVDAAGRNVTARGIQSVARDLDFNVRLWTLGSRVTELLAA